MKFRTAVEHTDEIAPFFRDQINALSKAHQNSIIVRRRRRITGSVNLDLALQSRYPNAKRWDYAIGYYISNRHDKAFFVEYHKANVYEVSRVLEKKHWLESWMRGKPVDNIQQRRWFWVSAGAIKIPPNSPDHRLLNMRGVQLVRRLELS